VGASRHAPRRSPDECDEHHLASQRPTRHGARRPSLRAAKRDPDSAARMAVKGVSSDPAAMRGDERIQWRSGMRDQRRRAKRKLGLPVYNAINLSDPARTISCSEMQE
jgi:hypothetical protein